MISICNYRYGIGNVDRRRISLTKVAPGRSFRTLWPVCSASGDDTYNFNVISPGCSWANKLSELLSDNKFIDTKQMGLGIGWQKDPFWNIKV